MLTRWTRVKQQLEAKDKECQLLRSQVLGQETLRKMLEKFDDSLSVLEENIAQGLSKIERWLESLETVIKDHNDCLPSFGDFPSALCSIPAARKFERGSLHQHTSSKTCSRDTSGNNSFNFITGKSFNSFNICCKARNTGITSFNVPLSKQCYGPCQRRCSADLRDAQPNTRCSSCTWQGRHSTSMRCETAPAVF